MGPNDQPVFLDCLLNCLNARSESATLAESAALALRDRGDFSTASTG
jgi:hypothetical protein